MCVPHFLRDSTEIEIAPSFFSRTTLIRRTSKILLRNFACSILSDVTLSERLAQRAKWSHFRSVSTEKVLSSPPLMFLSMAMNRFFFLALSYSFFSLFLDDPCICKIESTFLPCSIRQKFDSSILEFCRTEAVFRDPGLVL